MKWKYKYGELELKFMFKIKIAAGVMLRTCLRVLKFSEYETTRNL